MQTVSEALAAAGITGPHFWEIRSGNSGLKWDAPRPILEPETTDVLCLDYFQRPRPLES